MSRSLAFLISLLFLLHPEAARAVAPETSAASVAPEPEEEPAPSSNDAKRDKRRKRKKRRKDKDGPLLAWRPAEGVRLTVPVRVTLGAGGLVGSQYRDVSGPIGTLQVSATPRLRLKGGMALRAPLEHERRETFGFDLAQRATRAGLGVTVPLGEGLRASLDGSFLRLDRPDWPDFYQPVVDGDGQPTGTYLPTDRYSFSAWTLTGQVRWRLDRTSSVRAYAEVLDRAYDVDPAYDPIEAPTHLVPADLGRVLAGVRLDRKALGGRWRQQFRLEGSLMDYAWAYARDAGTGRTHATPGGPPPNPLQAFRRFTVGHRSSLWLKPLKLRLVGDLAYEHNQDTYDGYYTWNGWDLGLTARWRPVRRWVVEASYAGNWHGYTATGYQAVGSHLPLDDGAGRRWELKQRFGATVGYRPRIERVRPFVTGSWTRRDTNFPDYVPYENPASRPYDIGFDYTNLELVAGLELRL